MRPVRVKRDGILTARRRKGERRRAIQLQLDLVGQGRVSIQASGGGKRLQPRMNAVDPPGRIVEAGARLEVDRLPGDLKLHIVLEPGDVLDAERDERILPADGGRRLGLDET